MENIIKKLATLGFTNYESKVFLVLMKGGNMSAAEIAEEANIPRTSVYDILKIFTEKGYCNEIETSTKLKYEIIDPNVIEDKILNELNNDFKNKSNELKSSFEYLKPLYSEGDLKEKSSDVELIKGFNRHRELKMLDILKKADKEILLMNKLEGRISDTQDDVVKKFIKRKGKLRSIYQEGNSFKIKSGDNWIDVTDEELIKLYESFEKQGVEVKIAKKIPQFMIISDRNCVFISLKDESKPKHNRIDLIVKDKNFGDAMGEFFDSLWDKSISVSDFKKQLKGK